MARDDFRLEEFKALYKTISHSQTAYQRLELVAFAGAFSAYTVLLSAKAPFPDWIWYAATFAFTLCAVRACSYYVLINFVIAPHLARIEQAVLASDPLPGYQTSLTRARWPNLAVGFGGWLFLVAASGLAAYGGPDYVRSREAQNAPKSAVVAGTCIPALR